VDNVKREDAIVGGLAVLLIIVLVAFPWFSIGIGPFSFTLTATDAPDGWLGVLAVIALIALIVDLGVELFSPQTQVPAIADSRKMTQFVLAAAAAFFMFLKFLFHIGHFSDLGWGFWVGVIIVAALVFMTAQARTAGVSAAPMPRRRPAPSNGPTPDAGSTSTPPPSTPPPSSSSEPPSSSPGSR
jgi:hypothetical protein